jgi:hypothetical protein
MERGDKCHCPRRLSGRYFDKLVFVVMLMNVFSWDNNVGIKKPNFRGYTKQNSINQLF